MISKEDKIEAVKDAYNKYPSRLEAQLALAEQYNVTPRTVRNWAALTNEVKDSDVEEKLKKKELSSKPVYFFTWGQISTPAHKELIENMEAYSKFWDAEIGVIAGRYSNPTSIFKDSSDDDFWDPRIEKYLTLNRHNVHKYLSILADVKVLPTANTPMTGFEGFESEVSIILGHPRVQMKVVPTLEGYRKKEIFTTGACTVRNYTDSKAGKKGEFHHTLGFVIVELDGDEFYMRHVTACDDGSFMDLDFSISEGKVSKMEGIELYACGDKHFGEEDPVMEHTGREMIKRLKPKYVRLDDIFNGHSVNPHEGKDPIKKYERHVNGELSIKFELEVLKESLRWYNDQDFEVVIPRCNHDIFLDRYVASQDWKKDIQNAREYMEFAGILMDGKAPKGLIPYHIKLWYPEMNTLTVDESFRVAEFEQSVHGHRGANGSKGSVIQFKRLSTKMITMHTHSPSRYDGVLTGGTNTLLRVGYNEGPSSWLHCDVIVHPNGKAQHLIYHNYKCTTTNG